MKKIIILIYILLCSITLQAQTRNVIKISTSINTIGLDVGGFGALNTTRTKEYISLDIGAKYKKLKVCYFNVGYGYMITQKVFLIGLLGAYSESKEIPFIINYGGEVGMFVDKNLIGSIFCTNKTLGIKFGFTFKNNLDN